ncbi:Transcription factor gte11 [Thalictrum thalictroides]|uniref:Transcription factor gte11 n=1 Tax=Thalictrum thalictroides TaxID=46969 RepID=A0A7J6V8W8_THATH|nr:Transcription factor gte11 [Thalictrum thalictroides]
MRDMHNTGISFSSRQASVSVSDKSRPSSACVNGSCESMNSRVSRKNSFSSGSLTKSLIAFIDINFGDKMLLNTILQRNLEPSIHLDVEPLFILKIYLWDICVIDEENSHPSSRPSTPGNDVGLDEGWENSLYDGHLSPSKALRAAILRSRFADTIVKAQQKTLLNNGGKSDPVKLKQEKERLEKQQREEKARIEAQIRAAEAASRMREEMELKMQREREREAARIALQKMERTVEIYENLDILKDLEMLGASLEQDILVHNASPLARLGLFIKDEDLEDEDELETCSQVVELENHSLVVEVKNCNTDLEVENCSTDLNLENNNADVEEGEIA